MVLRDQAWLEERFVQIWNRGFPDLFPENILEVRWGRNARMRLGSIRMTQDKKTSRILINKLFQNSKVPLEVIDAVIAHELTHYVHGFSSPLEQKFSTPHAGGVVDKELKKRGFTEELAFQKKWLKSVWPEFLKQHGPPRRRRPSRRRFIRRRSILGAFLDFNL